MSGSLHRAFEKERSKNTRQRFEVTSGTWSAGNLKRQLSGFGGSLGPL